ncbi:Dimeric alpha-beta barrel [Moelleriella libera RCEF 2490]|uniref:Dimeric alpha-beta barrel n=1 Tax=Moelleriella libera RCEF 2490 TaxID=1081109 RepID=A0A168E0C7_9HYPO|nr:Dimeric alpha-beta barrel [Moelleriella libera RCEF 2490]
MSPPGILCVAMTPRPGLAPAQFHDWYNNEHGPTRLRMPDVFASGLRYSAAAGGQPAFLALYDITAMSRLEADAYTALRAHRSPREAATIGQVDVERRLYDLVYARQSSSFVPMAQLTDAEAAGIVTVAVEVELMGVPGAADQYRAWFQDEHAEMLAKVPGWLRSRLFRTTPPLVVGNTGSEARCFCLHDYAPQNGLGGPEHTASMDTPRRTDVFTKYVAAETRQTWSLFYIFGPAPRDLASLSAAAAAFRSPDGTTVTSPGPDAVISSSITTRDALTIPYRLEGNPSPDAPVIAFVNSLLTSLHMWDALVAILRRDRPDVRILRYDARGRHAIPQPPVAATLDTVTDDLLQVLDALRIPRLHALVGVSMGGATTLSFALKHPSRLGRFIACDFNAASSPANTQAWKDRIAVAEADAGNGIETLAVQTVERWFHPASRQKHDTAAAAMTQMVARNSVQGFRESCTALWDYDLRPGMAGCRVPGLFVAGEADAKGALVRAMDGFRGLLGAGGAQLRVVPQTGHLPMFEDADAFWNVVCDFL